MTAPTGGRLIFSSTLGPVGLSINDGVHPIFPPPQQGAYNLEVFTDPAGTGHPLDRGFNGWIVDPGGTLVSGFLTGTDVQVVAGPLLIMTR